jgi:hypothetical protein
MRIRDGLRAGLLCAILALGALMCVPMRADEIEELMNAIRRPKITHTIRDDNDQDGDLLAKCWKRVKLKLARRP